MLHEKAVFASFLPLLAVASSCAQTANVSDLYASPDSDGSRRRTTFFTDSKEINCVAEIGIGRDDVTLEMRIRVLQLYDFAQNRYTDTNVVLANLDTHPDKTSDKPGKVFLQIKALGPDGKPDAKAPFFAGRAQCEALIDGNLLKTAIFNVEFPPCPTAFITPGTRCFGTYKAGTQCNAAGDTGSSQNKCTCDEVKGWQC